jgi:hypothetical protein
MKVANTGKTATSSITYEGAPFVKVTARYWFTTKSDYTDAMGHYFINYQFSNDVNYQIKFNSDWAKINQANIGTVIAYKDGPKKTGGWDYTSVKGMESYLWKIIMRGVYDWHFVYTSHFNLSSPPMDLKIRGITGSWNGQCNMIRTTLANIPTPITQIMTLYFNDIRVGDPNEYYYYIYKTTVHELAHAAHWKSMANDDTNRNLRMIRSK